MPATIDNVGKNKLLKLIFFSTFDCRERRIHHFAMGQAYAIVRSYNQMNFKSKQKHFTTDLAKKGENNEF